MNKHLVENIKKAFAGVQLEGGIGLWEAQGIDDYATESQLLELRKKDKRTDWHLISFKDIALAQSSLSFVDALGMRFLLPQFLIFDVLQDEIREAEDFYAPDVTFTLTNNLQSEYREQQFKLLNEEQITIIIDFLSFKLNQNHNDYEVSQIKEALKYWSLKIKK